MKSTRLIINQLKNIPEGVVFDYSKLQIPPDKQVAAAKFLSRLVAKQKLRKVGKGKFYKPSFSRLGEMTPLLEELAKDLLCKDGKIIGYITGVAIFAQMGLTTQISSKILIGSPNYRPPLMKGGYEINFTLQKNKITKANIPLLRFLDAIKFIKKLPASTPDTVIKNLLIILSSFSSEETQKIISLASKYPPSTRAILGAMLENIGIDSVKLRESLNPLTKYNVGISGITLPTKTNWNIL